jgi:type II secretory pathway component GspD/PulD (secretin)
MNLTVKDVDVRDVLNGISLSAGINIVADSGVNKRISLSLRQVPLEEALNSVCRAAGLSYRKEGNIYFVGIATAPPPLTVEVKDNRLTLQVNNVEVKQVLHAIGAAAKVNLVPTPLVTGQNLPITITLTDVPLEDGVRLLLEAHGLTLEKKAERLYLVDKPKPPAPVVTNPTPPTAPPTQPPIVPPSQPVAPPRPRIAGRVTLDAENVPLGELLRKIADIAGVDLILTLPLDAQDKRTVHFVNAPVEDALRSLLKGTKYGLAKEPVIADVKPPTETQSGENNMGREALGVGREISNGSPTTPNAPRSTPHEADSGRFIIFDASKVGPEILPFLTTERVLLKHLKAEEATTFLAFGGDAKGGGAGIGGGLPIVRVLKDQNALSVTGTPDHIERFKRELALVDVAAPQIMIQSVVIETTANVLKDLGIDLIAGTSRAQLQSPTSANLTFSTLGGFTPQFTAKLTALIQEGKAHVLANPQVATINGKTATIDIVQQQFFRTFSLPTTTGGGGTGGQGSQVISPFVTGQIESIEAGIKLQITPTIGSEGDILVDVSPEVSSVTGAGPEGLPQLNTRKASATLHVKDGETIVLGGLRQQDNSKSVSKPFILGDLPFIGGLFRRSITNRRESELVILITPSRVKTEPAPPMAGQPLPLPPR